LTLSEARAAAPRRKRRGKPSSTQDSVLYRASGTAPFSPTRLGSLNRGHARPAWIALPTTTTRPDRRDAARLIHVSPVERTSLMSKGTANVSKRPRGKPFQRGQSGNPGGRPKRSATVEAYKIIADVKAAARELTPQALGTLQEIMEDKKAPPAARLTAATEILSRGWGRPAQRLEAEAGNGTMSFLALVQASFSPEVEARARARMVLEGHVIPEPSRESES
jgi:hypothetical protein